MNKIVSLSPKLEPKRQLITIFLKNMVKKYFHGILLYIQKLVSILYILCAIYSLVPFINWRNANADDDDDTEGEILE